MATVIDLLRQLGQDVGPDGGNAVCGLLEIPAAPLPTLGVAMPGTISAQWTRLTGRPTTAQHAFGLASARTGDPTCFVGPGAAPDEDLLLVTAALLAGDADSVGLWVVPDAEGAERAARLIGPLLDESQITWRGSTLGTGRDPTARWVVTTIDALHGRLLRFADRGWRWLWRNLRLIALPELHEVGGGSFNHLLWLMERIARVAPHDLRLLGALAATTNAEEIAEQLFGRTCRLVSTHVGRPEPTTVILWRCEDRARALRFLTDELGSRGLAIALLGRDDRETETLRSEGPRDSDVRVARPPHEARIAICAGVPIDAAGRTALLSGGYRLSIMLMAGEPYEQLLVSEPQRLLNGDLVAPFGRANPYIAACHLRAAAAESPITSLEIERWTAQDVAGRLIARKRLRLVGDLVYPGDESEERRSDLFAPVSGETAVTVRDPRGHTIARLAPAAADWRGLPGTSWGPGLVVANRSDQPPVVDLAVDYGVRVALPGVVLQLTPRETLSTRPASVGGKTLTVMHRKVFVRQRVESLIECVGGRAPTALPLQNPLESAWNALACSIPLEVAPPEPQVAGWAVNEALPLVVRCRPGELLISFDDSSGSLWLIETEPGGTGVAEAVAGHMERLLGEALALAHIAVGSPRYGALAHAEAQWLEALYNEQPVAASQPLPAQPARTAQTPPTSAGKTPEMLALKRRTRIYSEAAPVEPDEITWEAGTAPHDVEDVVWEPDPPINTTSESVLATQAGLPLLGQESPVPLNQPRQSTRYPRGSPADGRLVNSPRPAARPVRPPDRGPEQPATPSSVMRAAERQTTHPEPERQPDPPATDVGAMIARMRRLREEREQEHAIQRTGGGAPPRQDAQATLRFHNGQRVTCVPYGEGVVRSARIVGGREHVSITFPDVGTIEVDPGVVQLRVLNSEY
jgi:hypothetical protein